MGGIGFEFTETLAGSLRRPGEVGSDQAIACTFRGAADDSHAFARSGLLCLDGEVNAEGLADGQPLNGTLDMSALLRRRLPYKFTFRGNDGREYRFAGSKRVTFRRLLRSMTTLPAAIYDEAGEKVAQCELRFDYRSDVWGFLRSFRLRR